MPVLNTNSWHYKLAVWADRDLPWRVNMNLCKYLRTLLFGALCALIMFTIGVLFIAALADFGAWIAALLMTKRWIDANMGATFIVGLLTLGLLATGYITAWRWVEKKDPVPPIVRETYKSWKEKYCPIVTFDNKPPEDDTPYWL